MVLSESHEIIYKINHNGCMPLQMKYCVCMSLKYVTMQTKTTKLQKRYSPCQKNSLKSCEIQGGSPEVAVMVA